MSNVHFSSKTSEWETPQDLFDSIQKEFGIFDMDVCAINKNKKVKRFWDRIDNGLRQDWSGLLCWMNPPYGREIGKWIEKAATGGGFTGGRLTSRADRYQVVSRLYLRQTGNPIFAWPIKVRRIKKLCPLSFNARHFPSNLKDN